MKKQTYMLIITILSFLLLIGFALGAIVFAEKIVASKGEADFSSYDLQYTNSLTGEWEIYPNMLIASRGDLGDASYVSLPRESFINKTTYQYVSYRLFLKNIPLDREIKIGLLGEIEGYAVYINNTLIDSNDKLQDESGLVSLNQNRQNYTTDSNELEIIIELSNYDFSSTDLTRAPTISSSESYSQLFIINSAIKAVIVGALIFIFLYQLIVIGLRNKEPSALYFSILALVGALQVFFQRDLHLNYYSNLFGISQKAILYINQISIYVINLLFFLILFTFFKPKKAFRFNKFEAFLLIIPLIQIFLSAILPTKSYTHIINLFVLLTILYNLLLILYVSINQLKQEYGYYMLTLSIGLFITISMDFILDLNNLPYSLKTISGFYIIFTFIYSSVTSFIRESGISNVEELVELNKRIRDTEFAFLNSQIQSHFIYNSLNSIQALINTNPSRAAELIEDFSMYLRTRLEFNKMPQLFNIEDELENIRTYLNIEKARFGKRVEYYYDLQVGDFLIPPLTVQPLVENAVKHGISMKKTGGTVKISTYEDDNFIYIKVSDNGVGFNPATLDEKQRVGTENIRSRLSLHLNASMTITSQINKGTDSIIKIPKKVNTTKKKSK